MAPRSFPGSAPAESATAVGQSKGQGILDTDHQSLIGVALPIFAASEGNELLGKFIVSHCGSPFILLLLLFIARGRRARSCEVVLQADALIAAVAAVAVSRLGGAQAGNGGLEVAAKGLFGAGFLAADAVAPGFPALVEQLNRYCEAGLHVTAVVDERLDRRGQHFEIFDRLARAGGLDERGSRAGPAADSRAATS